MAGTITISATPPEGLTLEQLRDALAAEAAKLGAAVSLASVSAEGQTTFMVSGVEMGAKEPFSQIIEASDATEAASIALDGRGDGAIVAAVSAVDGSPSVDDTGPPEQPQRPAAGQAAAGEDGAGAGGVEDVGADVFDPGPDVGSRQEAETTEQGAS